MDWTTILRGQQADFIARIKTDHLLHCNIVGQHSELTVIRDENLENLTDFCWKMAEKYKKNSEVSQVFINNLKGKLGEEAVKSRLTSIVTEVDYEKRISGDGKVDFRLTSSPSVGIQVKARNGKIETLEWSISQEEIEKNAVLICILILEEVTPNKPKLEYNVILAGFLPTNMIPVSNGKSFIKIEELLYSGGLRSYLENFESYQSNKNINSPYELGLVFNQEAIGIEIIKNQLNKDLSESNNVDLISAVGIDYTKLRDLLAAEKWKEADQETALVMLQVAGRKKEGFLREEDIDNFPCEDLRTIDQLWVKYSDGRFGFSVQKRIYQKLGGSRGDNEKIRDAFGDAVGWRKGSSWLHYNDITFDKKAPLAHLPLVHLTSSEDGRRRLSSHIWEWLGYESCIDIFSRVEACRL